MSSRLFGTFLTWLNDHTSDVFVVCTSNGIDKLPPEFARAERFDGVFFVDLPSQKQRLGIWTIYQTLYGLEAQGLPKCDNWTGAEIKACCRLAKLLGVSLVEASANVVPVAITAGDAVSRLRSWASGRCLSADNSGIYQSSETSGARRAVTRKPIDDTPSVN